MNRATLIGHVGRDPEVKSMQSGSRMVSLSLATTESWRDKLSGERKERTEWHTVVIWSEGLVRLAEAYIHKGSKILVEGKIATRKWGQAGQERYATEIVLQGFNAQIILLDGAHKGGGKAGNAAESGSAVRHRAPSADERSKDCDTDLADEIPF